MAFQIMYFSLPFYYVFTHSSACTEQNLSERYQSATLFVNVTHTKHSGTVPYGISRSHYKTQINKNKVMKFGLAHDMKEYVEVEL